MRPSRLLLLSLLSCSSINCSILNAYDDVITTGNGGEAAGAGGSGTGGTPPAGGQGGTGAEGGQGGEPAPPLLTCEAFGTPATLTDLEAEANSRHFDPPMFAHQLNGENVVIVTRVGQELRGYLTNPETGVLVQTVTQPVNQLIASRTIGNKLAVLVQRPNIGGFSPIDLLVFDGDQGFHVDEFPISDGSLTPNSGYSRGVFTHIGPDFDDIALLLRYDVAGSRRVVYAHHTGGSAGEPDSLLFPDIFTGQEDGSPRGVIRRDNGTVHVFLDGGATGTQRWTFQETDATPGNGVKLTETGQVILIDALQKPDGTANLGFGYINDADLMLLAGNVSINDLNGFVAADLKEVFSPNSLNDFPSDGDLRWLQDSLLFFGSPDAKNRLVLLLADEDGHLKAQIDPLYTAEGFKYGDAAALTSDQPLADLGGTAYPVWTERIGTAPNDYDKLVIGAIGCEPGE
ncbi:MAG: hypothetical protein HOW73_01710 [Polyangiaceae bacterium]|nr:hypothetical protein [Polyangiaceae bacterium]